MWFSELTRSEVLSLLQGEVVAKAQLVKQPPRSLPEPPKGKYIVIWASDPGEEVRLPSAVISSHEDAVDLWSWAATYQPILNPLTAYTRVLTPTTARLWFAEHDSVRNLALRQNLCAAMMVAEAFCVLGGEAALNSLTPTGAAKLFSFVLGRADWLGFLDEAANELLEAWLWLRKYDTRPKMEATERQLFGVWVLSSHWTSTGRVRRRHSAALAAREMNILEALDGVATHGRVNDQVWHLLSKDDTQLAGALREDSTREERVRAVSEVIDAHQASGPGTVEQEFCLGYLMSRIAPGTLDHLVLAEGMRTKGTAPIIWYALLAGLHPESQVAFGGQGRYLRIVREVFRRDHPHDSPRADISIGELEQRTGKANRLAPLTTNSQGILAVEVLPGVVAYVSQQSAIKQQTPNMFEAKYQVTPQLLQQLDTAIEVLSEARAALQRPGTANDAADRGPKKPRSKKPRNRR